MKATWFNTLYLMRWHSMNVSVYWIYIDHWFPISIDMASGIGHWKMHIGQPGGIDLNWIDSYCGQKGHRQTTVVTSVPLVQRIHSFNTGTMIHHSLMCSTLEWKAEREKPDDVIVCDLILSIRIHFKFSSLLWNTEVETVHSVKLKFND